jgi:hypothetical protein
MCQEQSVRRHCIVTALSRKVVASPIFFSVFFLSEKWFSANGADSVNWYRLGRQLRPKQRPAAREPLKKGRVCERARSEQARQARHLAGRTDASGYNLPRVSTVEYVQGAKHFFMYLCINFEKERTGHCGDFF